jgi:hypothetical protein
MSSFNLSTGLVEVSAIDAAFAVDASMIVADACRGRLIDFRIRIDSDHRPIW